MTTIDAAHIYPTPVATPPVYLDWAASALPATPQRLPSPAGNPASAHAAGRDLAGRIDTARAQLAGAIGCEPTRVVFTSGATESNNIALLSLLAGVRADAPRSFAKGLVHSAIEHPSIVEPGRLLARLGMPVRVAAVGADGRLDLDRFEAALAEDTRLAAVMAVNNETGAIQPVAEALAIVRSRARALGKPILFHTDAVQALAKIEMVPLLDADTIAVSGHKVGGPRGVGALLSAHDLAVLATGGGQERGLRPGTENVDGILGFGECVAAGAGDLAGAAESVAQLTATLVSGALRRRLQVIPVQRLERPELYSPYVVMLAAPGLPAEVVVRVLSDRGVYVSRGSACGAGSSKPSAVLTAMGIDRTVASTAFRVSLGRSSNEEQIAAFFEALDATLKELAPALARGRSR